MFRYMAGAKIRSETKSQIMANIKVAKLKRAKKRPNLIYICYFSAQRYDPFPFLCRIPCIEYRMKPKHASIAMPFG